MTLLFEPAPFPEMLIVIPLGEANGVGEAEGFTDPDGVGEGEILAEKEGVGKTAAAVKLLFKEDALAEKSPKTP